VPAGSETTSLADDPVTGTATGGQGGPDTVTPARWWDGHDGLFPVAAFLGVAAVLMTTVWISVHHLRFNPTYPVPLPNAFLGDFLVEGWMRWDGGWYVTIAGNGYAYTPGTMSAVAFFPAYPLAIRLMHLVLRDPAYMLPAIAVTFACGLAATVLLHRWCGQVLARVATGLADDGARRAVARTTVLAVLVFPYAWYLYGAVYADALFLVGVLGAFVLLERDRPVLAGIVGMIATAGRPVGMGLVIGLVAVTLERRGALAVPGLERVQEVGWRRAWADARAGAGGRRAAGAWSLVAPSIALRRLRAGDAGVLLSLGGLVAWMRYLAVTFGDPLLFIHVEAVPGWEQGQGPRTWLKLSWLSNLRHLPMFIAEPHAHWDKLLYTVGTTFQALLVVGALCLVPAVIRRIGWGYAVYVLGVVAIPVLGTKDWQGTGRYLLAAFPVFIVVAWWLVERRAGRRRVVLAGSALLLVFLTSAFSRGFYLA
jgi:hypothetical protein